jgi:glutathione S-transferase
MDRRRRQFATGGEQHGEACVRRAQRRKCRQRWRQNPTEIVMAFTLVIGNKNYSSWSMRPWLALKGARIPFDEIVVPLYRPESKAKLLGFSPAGKVPVLIDGDVTVWDSLAIIEYVADLHPEVRLWPEDRASRALARTVAAEMHAGFAALRTECGMNIHRPPAARALSDEAKANIDRIQDIWSECRARYSHHGPFLFGAFGAADAMYAPVVWRFLTYAIDVRPVVRAYMDTMQAMPAWREWREAAVAEPWIIDRFEMP